MEVSASSATLSTMKRKNDAYLSTERFGRLFSFLTPYKRCWVLFQLTSPGLTQNTWLFPKKKHHKCQHTHTKRTDSLSLVSRRRWWSRSWSVSCKSCLREPWKGWLCCPGCQHIGMLVAKMPETYPKRVCENISNTLLFICCVAAHMVLLLICFGLGNLLDWRPAFTSFFDPL